MNNKQAPSKDRIEQDKRFKEMHETLLNSTIIPEDEKKTLVRLYNMTHAAHLNTAEGTTLLTGEVAEIYSKTQAKLDTKETKKAAKSNADLRITLPKVYNPISDLASYVEAHNVKVSDIKNFLKAIQNEEFLKIFKDDKKQQFLSNIKQMEASLAGLNDGDKIMSLNDDDKQKIKAIVGKFKQINPLLNISIETEKNQMHFKAEVADKVTSFDRMLFHMDFLKTTDNIKGYESELINKVKAVAKQARLATQTLDSLPSLCLDARATSQSSTKLESIAIMLNKAFESVKAEERVAAGLSDFYGLVNERIDFMAENLEEVKRFLASHNGIGAVIHELIKQVKNKGGEVKIDAAYLARYNRVIEAFGEQMKNQNPDHLRWVFSAIIPQLNIKNIEDLMKEPNKTYVNNAIKASAQFSSITKEHSVKTPHIDIPTPTQKAEVLTKEYVKVEAQKPVVTLTTPKKKTKEMAKKTKEDDVEKIDFFKKEKGHHSHKKRSHTEHSKKEYKGEGLTIKTKEQDRIRHTIAKEGVSSRHRSSDSGSSRSR